MLFCFIQFLNQPPIMEPILDLPLCIHIFQSAIPPYVLTLNTKYIMIYAHTCFWSDDIKNGQHILLLSLQIIKKVCSYVLDNMMMS